jgi:short-subunit dehydrogenase
MPSNRTALITGASSGIGEDFAHVFAMNGFDLVLVARREDMLNKLAETVRDRYSVQVNVLPCDLAAPDAVDSIIAKLTSEDIHIDALVNNAGYAENGMIMELGWDKHMAMQQVMLTGYLELCYRLVPAMKDRHYGRIINVSSAGALAPPMKGSLYVPIKSYVIDMSVALDYELREFGINCTVICPGFTRTEFQETMGIQEAVDSIPDFMWQSARVVAEEGYNAVMRGQVYKVNGWTNRVLAVLLRLLPRPLFYALGRNATIIPTD